MTDIECLVSAIKKNLIFYKNTDSRLYTRSWEYSLFLYFHLNPGYYNKSIKCKIVGRRIYFSGVFQKYRTEKFLCGQHREL